MSYYAYRNSSNYQSYGRSTYNSNNSGRTSTFNMNSSIQDSNLNVQYLNLLDQPPFIIKINDKEYKCNPFGVLSSKVIQEYRNKNPDSNQYEYNYENTNNEFQVICDIFNFNPVQLTTKNMNSLLHICEDLQIETFLNKITTFSELYESIIQESENIDEIYTWLYQIQSFTVETVKNSILNSIWIENFENIKEFVSIFLQVVRTTTYQNQSFLIELLSSLHQCSNEVSQLKDLMPFFIEKMKSFFFTCNLYCSFLYRMTQKGLISIGEIIDLICTVDPVFSEDPKKTNILDLPCEKFEVTHHKNIVMWFFPELYEIKNFSTDKILKNLNENDSSLIQKYLPEKISAFKQLRDSGIPDNDLERSIYFDDVDGLQKIITNNRIDINSTKISNNFFNVFDRSIKKSFINYAAECASIKCFKFLLLNHADIDKMTYGFAIYGGNTEIVRIVDQQNQLQKPKENEKTKTNSPNTNRTYAYRKNTSSSSNSNSSKDDFNLNSFFYSENLTNPINLTIIMHKYDLFDWLFEKQIENKSNNDSFNEMAKISVQNGNMHSFIQFIDNGLILSKNPNLTNVLVKISSVLGFYRFTKLLCSLVESIQIIQHYPLVYGSLSIFKLFFNNEKLGTSIDFDKLLSIAIKKNYIDIIHYIIEEKLFPTDDEKKINSFNFIETAVSLKDPTIFNYLETKFSLKDLQEKYKYSRNQFLNLLKESCTSGNIKAVEKITDFIISNSEKESFTQPFILAGSSGHEEICQYFIDKKVNLNASSILQNYKLLASKVGKTILGFLNSVDQKTKEAFSNFFLSEAIIKGNVNLVNTLLNKEALDNQALFNAVKSRNIEIVSKILQYNSKPSFINQLSPEGTALNIAVYNNDIHIVKLLLSLKEINPSLRNNNGMTPLITSIINFNFRIFNLLIDFYGENIQDQNWQIKKALKNLLKKPTKNTFQNLYPILDRLSSINEIDLNFYIKNQTLLNMACQSSDRKLVEILLKSKKIDANLYDLKTSDNSLLISIDKKDYNISCLLIENSNIDINYKNNSFKTALIYAVINKFDKIVPVILNHEKFDPHESNLDYAFFISESPITNFLYEAKGLNVNYKMCQNKKSEYSFETCLKHAINKNDIEKVEMIISHPSFDASESFASEVIFSNIFMKNYPLLKKILQSTNNDINMTSPTGKSLFVFCAEKGSEVAIHEFLNDKEFKPTKNDFISAFISISTQSNYIKSKAPIEIMNEMVKYDETNNNHFINFGELLNNGKSFYTMISPSLTNIDEIVQFFLDHKVDPNMPDSEGIYPLEYAILTETKSFIVSLLNSEKVDFSVQLRDDENFTTLIASSCANEEILKEFVDRKLVDPNSKEFQKARQLIKPSSLRGNQGPIDLIDEIVMLTEDSDKPITRQMIYNNIDLYEKVYNFYDLDISHKKLFEFTQTFYQMAIDKMNDEHGYPDRRIINSDLIQRIIMLTEDTDHPITKSMIINNFKVFMALIDNYGINPGDENNMRFEQLMEFSKSFYNYVRSNNDDDS